MERLVLGCWQFGSVGMFLGWGWGMCLGFGVGSRLEGVRLQVKLIAEGLLQKAPRWWSCRDVTGRGAEGVSCQM